MYATASAKKVALQAKHAAIKKKSTSELNEPAEWSHRTVKKKKKKLADRIASRDEFSKPLDPVPEKIEFNQEENTIPIETYVEHQQLELRHDHDVNINNLVPIPDTSVDIVPIRPGDTD